jgi:hypothetical protein
MIEKASGYEKSGDYLNHGLPHRAQARHLIEVSFTTTRSICECKAQYIILMSDAQHCVSMEEGAKHN